MNCAIPFRLLLRATRETREISTGIAIPIRVRCDLACFISSGGMVEGTGRPSLISSANFSMCAMKAIESATGGKNEICSIVFKLQGLKRLKPIALLEYIKPLMNARTDPEYLID